MTLITQSLKQGLLEKFRSQVSAETDWHVQFVLKEIAQLGHQAYIVGGTVRDLLLGNAPKDIDMCTSAPLELLKSKFSDIDGLSIIDTGIEHGTVTFHFKSNGDDFEITRFRKDVSTDGRRATVSFTNSLQEDLKRRDLTVNAIAWNPLTEELITGTDFDGVSDLVSGKLRFVGDAVERVAEDHLRAVRFLRFSVQLKSFGFTFNKSVWKNKILPIFDESVLSFERIISEFEKILKHSDNLSEKEIQFIAERASELKLFKRLGLESVENLTIEDMLRFGSFAPLVEDFLKSHDRNVKLANEQLKLSSTLIKQVHELIKIEGFIPKDILFKEILAVFKTKEEAQKSIKDIQAIFQGISAKEFLNEFTRIVDNGEPFLLSHLAINGNDLTEAGLSGKEIGIKLHNFLSLVKRFPNMNTKEKLLTFK